MPILTALPEAAAVAVIRLRSLGDCVLSTPAISLLKKARPDLRVCLVAEERFHPVFTGNPDITELLLPSFTALRKAGPQLCLNLHGGTRSLLLTLGSGARFRAGFAHYRFGAAYNIRIPRAQQVLGAERKIHTAEHVASAMFYLGVPVQPIPRARLYARAIRGRDCYAVIHPVAATSEKTWPVESFIKTARWLESECGLTPIFIGAAEDDLSAFGNFRCALGEPLESIKTTIAGASLFLGNDSGPAHIAAAFGIPSVVLFGPSDSVVWAPWKVEAEVLQADPISQIPVERVISALTRLREPHATVAR